MRTTHGFSADKMYFPPNKSMKPDFINFIVEILESAFFAILLFIKSHISFTTNFSWDFGNVSVCHNVNVIVHLFFCLFALILISMPLKRPTNTCYMAHFGLAPGQSIPEEEKGLSAKNH